MPEGGMGMQGIDVEAAVGRKHDDDEEAKPDVDADEDADVEGEAKSPGAESVGTKREADLDLEASVHKKIKEDEAEDDKKTNGDATTDAKAGAVKNEETKAPVEETKTEDDADKMDTE
jgi:hypothetical protein